MAISMTEKAASHIQNFLDQRGKGVGLRLAVKTSGCSGLAYVLEFVDELEEGDQVFEDQGVKVIVDPKSMVYLDGTELDFCQAFSILEKDGFRVGVVGALGVGIGFGLQNIVNNFVSGLILIFERPIQAGDTIQLTDLVGKVSRIGFRSSTIRTFDGAEVIEDLVAAAVFLS